MKGGWPGSNPRDQRFFELAKDVLFKKAKITAFGSTRRPNVVVEKDPNLKALLESGTNTVAIFGKSWDLHVETVMGIKPEENLSMIRESVAYLKKPSKRSDI